MTILYYLIFLFVGLIEEISRLEDPDKVLQKSKEYKEYARKKKEDPNTLAPDSMFFQGVYFVLTIIGLFTSQWIIFLILFALGFVPKKWKAWIIFDSAISIVLILFIVMNKFHLHINMTTYFLSLF